MHRKVGHYIHQSQGGSKIKQQAIPTKRTKVTSISDPIPNFRSHSTLMLYLYPNTSSEVPEDGGLSDEELITSVSTASTPSR